jgi:prolipoprotein diacylglyceryltransferase
MPLDHSGYLAYLPSPARDAWQLGPVPLRAQQLAIVAGIVVALVIADYRYRRAGGPQGVLADIAAWAVPAGLIPAAIAELTAQARTQPWQAVHTAEAIVGFPGAVALGLLAAWFAGQRVRGPQRRRVKFGPVLAAVAPAIAFGYAVAQVGAWAAQQGFGRPSSLPWAVAIAPVHRPPGFENFPTFTPIFLYQAIWDVMAGIAIVLIAKRWSMSGDRVFALGAIGYAIGGFGLFWLGIGHLPIILGLRAGELGDALVLVGAVVYLVRTRRTRTKPLQTAHKPALERDSTVM